MKIASYDIVFQEVPDEITLALSITNCPYRCKGCHSAHLWADTGILLDEQTLHQLVLSYEKAITCVGFMGGDSDLTTLYELAQKVRDWGYKTAWYTGCTTLPNDYPLSIFDYIKIGPYIESLGGLKSAVTNQRLYKIENGQMHDITFRFRKN